jgi:hypothetical protein
LSGHSPGLELSSFPKWYETNPARLTGRGELCPVIPPAIKGSDPVAGMENRYDQCQCNLSVPMRTSTSLALIVISLAAVAGVAYGSYRAKSQTDRLETRVQALEQAQQGAAKTTEQLQADKQKLCATVDPVRQKITGVVLAPGNAPNFDVLADPLSAPERIILTLYNWCHD